MEIVWRLTWVANMTDMCAYETDQYRSSGDGGIDCMAYKRNPVAPMKIAVQAKLYTKTVHPTHVRDLYGTMQHEGATQGIMITTSGCGPVSRPPLTALLPLSQASSWPGFAPAGAEDAGGDAVFLADRQQAGAVDDVQGLALANSSLPLAGRLQDAVAGSAIVHTDDIAWWYSRFGWAELLVNAVLIPARSGEAVSYRPPPWDERKRQGAIEVPPGCPLLIIEGVGAARRECAHLIDAAIWVQSDERETERRNLARVGQPEGLPTEQESTANGWPRRSPSKPASDPGNAPTSSSAVRRRFPSTLVIAPPIARSG
jgi:Restriction endonuclease